MSLFDLILLLIIFGFIWFGFWFGLISTVGGLIGLVLGIILASRWYGILALKLIPLGLSQNLAKIAAFLILFIAIRLVVGLIFKFLDKIFNFISIIPFLKTINRLAGAILGLIEGGLIVGLILFFSTKFPLGQGWSKILTESKFAASLIKFAKILLPLIPAAIKQIQSVIKM